MQELDDNALLREYVAHGSEEALQREIKNKLGLVAHPETRDMDVLVLKVRNINAPGLQPPIIGGKLDWMWFKEGVGRYACADLPLSTTPPAPAGGLAKYLEMYLHKPVIDQTGITNHFHIEISWKQRDSKNYDAMKETILDQLGLELVPDRLPVEMLVVEKVK